MPFAFPTRLSLLLQTCAPNGTHLQFIYLFYPETAGRSLEEIDIIFARGYVEKVSYVKMAKEMPSLTTAEIAAEWQR